MLFFLYLSVSELWRLQNFKVTIIWVPRFFFKYLDLIKKWICSSVIWSLYECLPAEVPTGTFWFDLKNLTHITINLSPNFITRYQCMNEYQNIWRYFLEICLTSILETWALFCHSPVCIKTYYVTVDLLIFLLIYKISSFALTQCFFWPFQN